MKQSDRSKRRIVGALFKLLENEPYESITVKQLADTAGVARLTFYRNFESKDAVLEKYFQDSFVEYIGSLGEGTPTLEEALGRCFEYWGRHRHNLSLLQDNNLFTALAAPFSTYMETMLERCGASVAWTDTQKRFVIGGLFFSMLGWAQKEDDESPEQAARNILDLLGLSGLESPSLVP